MVQTKSPVSSRVLKFLRLPLGSKVLLLEAWMTLGLSRGMVLTLPFRWIAPRLQARLPDSAHVSGQAEARAVGWALRVASKYTPWTSNCLAQALAGKRMLHRRKLTSTIFLGVRKGEQDEFEAHAWLDCGSVTLTGGHDHAGYSVVSSYPDEQT